MITVLLSIVILTFLTQFSSAVLDTYFSLSSSTTQTNDSRQIIMADYNLDGHIDYVVRNQGQNDDYYINSGTGAFTRHSTITDLASVTFAAGDVDRDSDTDLFYVADTGFFVAKNRSANSSSGFLVNACFFHCPAGDPFYTDVELGDLDNDGDLDAVFGQITQSAQMIALNSGTGSFALANSTFADSNKVLLVDVTHDNYLDLVMVTTAGGLRVYRNSGTGGFILHSSKVGMSLVNTAMAIGDVNNDGNPDFINIESTQTLSIHMGASDGRIPLGRNTLVTSMANTKSIALGDIDNDGHIDIMLGGNHSGSVGGGAAYYLNDGNGNFTTEYTTTQVDDNTDDIAFADIDNDADLDYVRANRGAVANRHYLSNVAATIANATPSAPSTLSVTQIYPASNTGRTIVSDAGTGSVAWSNPGNAGRSDDAYATASLTSSNPSEYLKLTNFGFRIANDATILGIRVEVERTASANNAIYDNAVRLVKGGTIQTYNNADPAAPSFTWSANDSSAGYGGTTDVWANTWTPQDINSANFGVAFAVKSLSGAAVTASVDKVTVSIYTNQSTVVLQWGSGSDTTESAKKLLQYAVRMGTGSAAQNTISAQVHSPSYATRQLGNASVLKYILHNLPCSRTYTWSVATVDVGLRRSSYSSENSFTLSSTCAFTAGSSGGSSSESGGGWGWNVVRPKPSGKWDTIPEKEDKEDEEEAEAVPGNATVTVHAFFDANRNGSRDAGERLGFAGHTVTVSDSQGKTITEKVGRKGTVGFSLPAGEKNTYAFTIDPKAKNGYTYFVTSDQSGHGFEELNEYTIELGMTYKEVLQYIPCMKISARQAISSEDDAKVLLGQLDDIYGNPILKDVNVNEILVTRKTFMMMLSKAHCVSLVTESQAQKIAKQPLTDVPLTPFGPEQRLVYSLVASGVPVTNASNASIVDLGTPISRGDAVLMLYALLKLPAADVDVSKYPLPVDVDPATDIGNAYIRLDMMNVLPQSFRTIFGADRGMTQSEMAIMIARSALIMGRISLVDDAQYQTESVPTPTFLASTIPGIYKQPCFESNTDRMDDFTFSDVLPGNPFYEPLRSLLQYRILNSENQYVSLVTGVQRLTEFGVDKGVTDIDLAGPASAIDTLRTLLVLTCRWPIPKVLVDQGAFDVTQGTLGQFAGDKVFDLPQSSSLMWRVAAKAQRTETYGNFSLFTLAPKLLRLPPRSPYKPFTLEEAGDLFASVLLMTAAEQGIITPQEAENRVAETKEVILNDITSRLGITREEARLIPLSRGELLYFTSVIADQRLTASSNELQSFTSLAEQWFARIMR